MSEPKKNVLNGTGKTRKYQHKIQTQNGGRDSITGIPTRLEAIFITFAKSGDNTGSILTREELDQNPATWHLPLEEKNALVKYWPKFVGAQNRAREIKEGREADIVYALKASKEAREIALSSGMDSVSLPEQMKLTAKVYEQKIQNAALVLATTSIDELGTDKLSLELYRVRVQYIKDFAWIRDKISDLSDRLIKDEVGFMANNQMADEALALLQSADEALIRKGHKVAVSE